MKYPSSSLHNSRPSSILSPTCNIDDSPSVAAARLLLHVVAARHCCCMTELLAKFDAEILAEQQLLEEAAELLPPQAPPETTSGLIHRTHPRSSSPANSPGDPALASSVAQHTAHSLLSFLTPQGRQREPRSGSTQPPNNWKPLRELVRDM